MDCISTRIEKDSKALGGPENGESCPSWNRCSGCWSKERREKVLRGYINRWPWLCERKLKRETERIGKRRILIETKSEIVKGWFAVVGGFATRRTKGHHENSCESSKIDLETTFVVTDPLRGIFDFVFLGDSQQIFGTLLVGVLAGYEEEHSTYHETSKPVHVPIYKKYAIPIPHPVPVPVPQHIKVPIPQPYQVQVAIPHPVPVEVVKQIEIPVEKPEPYVVEKKVSAYRFFRQFRAFVFTSWIFWFILFSSLFSNIRNLSVFERSRKNRQKWQISFSTSEISCITNAPQ